jgi:hypothetical protein
MKTIKLAKLDRLTNFSRLTKLSRVELGLIGGIAMQAGIMLYLILSQGGPAVRCGFC